MYFNNILNDNNNVIYNLSQIGTNNPFGFIQFQISKIGQRKKSFGK